MSQNKYLKAPPVGSQPVSPPLPRGELETRVSSGSSLRSSPGLKQLQLFGQPADKHNRVNLVEAPPSAFTYRSNFLTVFSESGAKRRRSRHNAIFSPSERLPHIEGDVLVKERFDLVQARQIRAFDLALHIHADDCVTG